MKNEKEYGQMKIVSLDGSTVYKHSLHLFGLSGLTALKNLLDTYFGNGGMQIQVSVADTEVLKKAQQDPDSYRDLMVRITGYSAIFTDMSKRGQDEVIRRDEMN